MCELRELPDVRQLANVIIGEVERFEHRDLGELSERHERNYSIMAQVEGLECACNVL